MEMFITILLFVPAILISLIVHEYAHARVAYNLGDPTAKYSGRLTLNPMNHLDLWGALVLVTTFLASGGKFCFGWAKPVPINPYNFKNYFKDSMLVGLAGPLANFAMAASGGLLFRLLIPSSYNTFTLILLLFLKTFIVVNIGLGLFNLIPVPPLDGSRILMGLMPKDLAWKYNELERTSPMIIFFILIILIVTGLINVILVPPFVFLYKLFTGVG
ncbi:MAG: site-2 protease family protein [Armatimonadota bacterium]